LDFKSTCSYGVGQNCNLYVKHSLPQERDVTRIHHAIWEGRFHSPRA
jgi:hypothetical protein